MTGYLSDDLSDGVGWTPPTLEQWRQAQREDAAKPEPRRPRPSDLAVAIRPVWEWMIDAACKGHDPQKWTKPTDGGLAAEAICASCPVRQNCLEWVLTQPQLARAGMVAGGHLWTTKGKPTQRLPRKSCRQCGDEFQPLRKADTFCSDPCRRRNQLGRGRCIVCGARVGQDGARFCSNACRCQDYYAKNREAELERKRRERKSRPPFKDEVACCTARRDALGRLPIGFCGPDCERAHRVPPTSSSAPQPSDERLG